MELRTRIFSSVLTLLAVLTPELVRAEKFSPPVYHYNLNPLNESQGYILGRVTKAARVRPYEGFTGAVVGIFYAPLVAEVRLGSSTTSVYRIDRDCLKEQEEKLRAEIDESPSLPNPNTGGSNQQMFSINRDLCRRKFTPMELRTDDRQLIKKLTHSISQSKLISFVKSRFILSTDVYDIVEEVYPVSPNHKFGRSFVDRISDFPISRWFNVQSGTAYGRIVRAEVEGNLRESYLITAEVGSRGNQFIEMNITSPELYRFAIECMFSNRPLKMNYLDISDTAQAIPELIYGYRTKHRLYRIELANSVDGTEP